MTGAGAVIAGEAKQSQPANVVAEIAWALSAPRNDQKSRRPRNPVRADLQKSLPECLPAHVVEFLPSNAKRETGRMPCGHSRGCRSALSPLSCFFPPTTP